MPPDPNVPPQKETVSAVRILIGILGVIVIAALLTIGAGHFVRSNGRLGMKIATVAHANSSAEQASETPSQGKQKAPDWVPVYPGITPNVSTFQQGAGAEVTTYSFKTKDAPSKVLNFYEDALKNGGFTITKKISRNGSTAITAENAPKKRSLVLTLDPDAGQTLINVMASQKK